MFTFSSFYTFMGEISSHRTEGSERTSNFHVFLGSYKLFMQCCNSIMIKLLFQLLQCLQLNSIINFGDNNKNSKYLHLFSLGEGKNYFSASYNFFCIKECIKWK